jgi:hypothetical protein
MARRKSLTTLNSSPTDIAKQEILMMSYRLACVLMKSSHYQQDKVMKVFEFFSDVESSTQKSVQTNSISDKRRSFLANLRNSD